MKNNYRIALNKAHKGVEHRKIKAQDIGEYNVAPGYNSAIMGPRQPVISDENVQITNPTPIWPADKTRAAYDAGAITNDGAMGITSGGEGFMPSGESMRDNSYASVDSRSMLGNIGTRIGNIFRSNEKDIDPRRKIVEHDGSSSPIKKNIRKQGGTTNYQAALKAYKKGGNVK